MRLGAYICLTLVILGAVLTRTNAQPPPASTHDITLYAHSHGNSLIMNASAPIGPGRCAGVNKTITFTLSPMLATSLRISGGTIVTVDLKANMAGSGTVFTWVSELKRTVERALVINISQPVRLSNLTEVVPLGIGPVDYTFQQGSSIQLNVLVIMTSSVTPYLCWDDVPKPGGLPPFLPTSVRIPTIDPILPPGIEICPNLPHTGTIVQWSPNSVCIISANVTDAFGAYRLSVAAILTGPNTTIPIQSTHISEYSLAYSYNATLEPGSWDFVIRILDSSGNTDAFDYRFWVVPFYSVRIHVVDRSHGSLEDALVETNFRHETKWVNITDSTGWTTMLLPSTSILGEPLNLIATWHNVTSELQRLTVVPNTQFTIIVPFDSFGLRVIMNGTQIPLPNAKVTLLNETIVAGNVTGLDGVAPFNRIPERNYTVRVQYLFTQFETKLNVNASINGKIVTVYVPIPYQIVAYAAILVLAVAASVLTIRFARRRSEFYPHDFSYLKELSSGGLPKTCFAVIAGNAGSGKSVLLESLAIEHLIGGEGCVYIINTEYPSRIREHMITLGMPTDLVNTTRLLFIDSYSAISGTTSTERFHVTSHTDLTNLGLEITKCLQELGSGTDVYLDSATPILASLRVDYLLSFLQSIAGKVKANDGKLCVTLGTGIDKSNMTKFEEISDCVIEVEMQESKKGQRRRLRVKKLRGKPYIDRWTTFRIKSGKGIVFLTGTKAERGRPSWKESNVPSESPVEELLRQAEADTGYVATARVIARLEELRAMGKLDDATYQRLKKEYEKRLERSKRSLIE